MSAQESIKGYLYQTLVTLLEMLEHDQWSEVTIEPEQTSEKVDIYWKGDFSKAAQVKSSKSRINQTTARKYIAELKQSYSDVEEYELILCGHVTGELKDGNIIDGVKLRIKASNPLEMTQQAAHLLDVFLNKYSVSQTPPVIRELLVRALISRLIEFATGGVSSKRTEFEEEIKSWVLACYPEAAKIARFATCEVANGPCEMYLGPTIDGRTGQPQNFEELFFIADLYFVNISNTASIIQFIVFGLKIDDQRYFFLPRYHYVPQNTVQSNAHSQNTLRQPNRQDGFEIVQPVCIPPKGVEHRKLVASSLSSQVSIELLQNKISSQYIIEVFIKYQHLDSYILTHSFDPNILFDELFDKKACIAYKLPDFEVDGQKIY